MRGLFLNDLRQLESSDPADAGPWRDRPGGPGAWLISACSSVSTDHAARCDSRAVPDDARLAILETDRIHEPLGIVPRHPLRRRRGLGRAGRAARRSGRLGAVPEMRRRWRRPARGRNIRSPTSSSSVSSTTMATIIPMLWGGEQSVGWRWRISEHNTDSRQGPVTQPEYWQTALRQGTARLSGGRRVMVRGRGVAVGWGNGSELQVAIAVLAQPPTSTLNLSSNLAPRLPTDAEWLRLAGGEKESKKERYPWDVPGSGRVTDYETEEGKAAILARANTYESGIGGTSPVAMYPLGESKPFGLRDLAGNVWEWTDSWYDKEQRGRVVRGGSWHSIQGNARPSGRGRSALSYSGVGFRVVFPISSGSDFWISGF